MNESFRERVAPVIAVVAAHYNVTPEQVYGRSRTATVERARSAAIWIVRAAFQYSFPELGKAFDRDPTTVRQAIMSVDARRHDDPEYCRLIDHLRDASLQAPAMESIFRNGKAFPEAVWSNLKKIKEGGTLGTTMEEVIINLVSMKIFELSLRKE